MLFFVVGSGRGTEKHITCINDYRQNKMKMASENIRNNINFLYYILCIDLNRAVNPFLAITFGEQPCYSVSCAQ